MRTLKRTLSGRSQRIPPFMVMEVLERAEALAREGKDIIHLEVGEPDFETPACIREAGIRAIQEGKTKYSHSLGLVELREEISRSYRCEYGVDVSPGRIIVTSGTSPAMLLLFSALLDEGDEIILSDPGYACHPNFIDFLGGKPVFADSSEESGFALDVAEVAGKVTDRTRGIFINSPSNPTGNVLSGETMAALAGMGTFVISDEIYHGLVYGGKARSILEFTEDAFVLNGFSKKYAMTGWRLGYVIVPEDFVRPMQKLQQNFFISAGTVAQYAGLAALREAGPDVARMRDVYGKRRLFMIRRLREIGFRVSVEPTGAFYILADCRRFDGDSRRLAFALLEETGVATTPGVDFGRNAEGCLRFSYANSLDEISRAMEKLEEFLAKGNHASR